MQFEELYIAFIDVGSRMEEIENAIVFKERLTDTFRLNKRIRHRGVYAICLSNEEISYFALGTKSGRVATYKDRITFTEFFGVSIALEKLFNQFPKLDTYEGTTGVLRIPPAATRNIYKWIEGFEPNLKDWLKYINDIKVTNRKTSVELEKNDSIRLALQMANFSPNRDNLKIQTAGNFPSFLTALNDNVLTEDEMINHDMSVFGDWGKRNSDIFGMACFEKQSERLFIWNVNRKPLESVLGVDLIYYVEEYNSFVMVQYKRMIREGDKWIYRPTDTSYHKELKNMEYFEELVSEIKIDSQDPSQFRLNTCPFYFKLCKSSMGSNKISETLPGMYIPLSYWETIINHSFDVKGKNGGKLVGYHNAKRWLTKEDFTGLVQKGWIGSQMPISDIIASLIRGSLEGDKLVTLAAKLKSSNVSSKFT